MGAIVSWLGKGLNLGPLRPKKAPERSRKVGFHLPRKGFMPKGTEWWQGPHMEAGASVLVVIQVVDLK